MATAAEALSGKLGLDTTDFKTGVREANRELRVLESSFRAGTAALGDWGSSATGLEKRVSTLTQKIDVQRLKVAALAEEHQRLVQANGENSVSAKNAEINLNNETETLGKMEAELSSTRGSLDEMKSSSDEAGESVKQTGEKAQQSGGKLVTLAQIMTGLNSVVELAKSAFNALRAVLTAVFNATIGFVFQSATAADQLVTLSAQTGISTDRLQEMKYAGDQLGVSLETISGANARLIRSMAGAKDGTGAQADAFKTLGVSVTDANGNLRDSQAVFADVINALGGISNPAERDALAMALFGKSAQELNPLIAAGSTELSRLAAEARKVGAVVSAETLGQLESLADQVDGLKGGLAGAGMSVAAFFAPFVSGLLTQATGYLKTFVGILTTWNGNTPMIISGVTGLFTRIISDLVAGMPQMIQTGLTILQTLLDALVAALPTILVAFGKTWDLLMKGLLDIGKWIGNINWKEVSDDFIKWLGTVDWNAIGLALGGFIKDAFQVGKDDAAKFDWTGVLVGLGGALKDFTLGLGGFTPEEWDALWANIKQQIKTSLDKNGPITTTVAVVISLSFALAELGGQRQTVERILKDIESGAFHLKLGIILLPTIENIGEFVSTIHNGITKGLGAIQANLMAAGIQLVLSVWKGMQSMKEWFSAQAYSFFKSIIDAAKDALGWHSPMKPFVAAGAEVPHSFALGMFGPAWGKLNQQMASAFGSLSFAPAYASTGANVAGGTTNTSNHYVTINGVNLGQVDRGTTIGSLLDYLNLPS